MKKYNFEEIVKFLTEKDLLGMQVYNTKNIIGDPMRTVYKKDGVVIDYCGLYGYYEIFGLTPKDFEKLKNLESSE